MTETPPPPDRVTALLVRGLYGTVRVVMLIGIASLIAAAATLLVFGAVATYRHIGMIIAPAGTELTSREVFLASIKLVDLVLLATVLEVVAIGLLALFIDSNIPVPSWLKKDGVDGLKNKLAGIVVVMLGVLFLEQVITAPMGPELLPMGIAVAVVIVALSYFIRAHPSKD